MGSLLGTAGPFSVLWLYVLNVPQHELLTHLIVSGSWIPML